MRLSLGEHETENGAVQWDVRNKEKDGGEIRAGGSLVQGLPSNAKSFLMRNYVSKGHGTDDTDPIYCISEILLVSL